MERFGGFIEGHKRAERIITHNLRRAWKPLREGAIKEVVNGDLTYYDVDVLANVLLRGILTAYIFGRVYGYGFILGIMKRHKSKVNAEFSMVETFTVEETIRMIYRKDKKVLALMLGLEVVKDITEDAFLEFFMPSEKALAFLRSYTVSLAHVEEIATRKEVTRLVSETIKEGLSEREAIKYMNKKMKIFTKNRIQKIARTEATRSFNLGNLEETYRSDVIVGYRYVAVLDERTTKNICKPRHGKFIPKENTAMIATNTPPLHVNCRSVLEPVSSFRDRSSLKILNLDQVDEGMQRPEDIEVVYNFLMNAR